MIQVDAQKISELIQKIFMGHGVPQADAAVIAKNLVDANLGGRATHGVVRVNSYVTRVKQGGANTTPDIKIVNETPVSAVLDGDNALGSLIADKAARICREKAQQCGISIVLAKNCNHFGASAYWNELIGQDDMITFSCCNTSPLLAPPGAKIPVLGSNPICVYVPSESHGPICLDISTSTVAQGRVDALRRKGQPLPDGWAVDENGLPTNDPEKVKALTPMAGHKGYGLAVLVDLLSGVLAGSGAFGDKVNDLYHELDKPNLVSYCFIAINLNMFRPAEEFRKEVDEYIDYLHGVPTVDGKPMFFPGEIELINKEKALAEGFVLPEDLIEELKGLAAEVGIADPASYFTL